MSAIEITIDDLQREDLDRIAWSGSSAHVRNVAEQLARVDRGEAEYLAVRNEQGVPIAIGLIDHTFAQNGSEIGQLSTHPDLQSRGLGTKLIEAAEERIQRRGHEWSILGVEVDNERARHLYERLGYQAYETMPDSWIAEDENGNEYVKTVDTILLRKRVGN